MKNMKSYQLDKLNQKHFSNVAGVQLCYGGEDMPPTPERVRTSDNFTDTHATSEKYRNFDSLPIHPPHYFQIAP